MKYTKVINGNLSQIKIASKTYNNIHKIYKFNNIILRSPNIIIYIIGIISIIIDSSSIVISSSIIEPSQIIKMTRAKNAYICTSSSWLV